MWKILREEIRKTASRKIIWCGIVLVLAFVTFRMGIVLKEYSATIDGQTYIGKEGIKKDQELAKDFAGPFTEEMVNAIHDRFGFYYYNEEKNEFVGNFWNEYITDKMTNTMETNGDDPNEIKFVEGEEWENNAAPLLKGDLRFDYLYGWEDFRETMTLVTLLMLIILIIGMAPVFSEEYTHHTADILLTTEHGKKKGIWLKTAAALITAAGTYCLVVLYMWLLYRVIFGTQGLNASAVLLTGPSIFGYCPKTVSGFFLLMMGLGLAAVILLTALVLAVSSASKNAFLSVVISAAVFIIPYVWMKVIAPMNIFGVGFTKVIWHFMVSMPYYLQMNWGYAFTADQIQLHIMIAVVTAFICVLLGYKKYRNYQG